MKRIQPAATMTARWMRVIRPRRTKAQRRILEARVATLSPDDCLAYVKGVFAEPIEYGRHEDFSCWRGWLPVAESSVSAAVMGYIYRAVRHCHVDSTSMIALADLMTRREMERAIARMRAGMERIIGGGLATTLRRWQQAAA